MITRVTFPPLFPPITLPRVGAGSAALHPTADTADLEAKIAQDVKPLTPAQTAQMVGLFFVQPTSEVAKSSIIPRLSDWHHRSDDYIHLYFAGYLNQAPSNPDLAAVQISFEPNKFWFYSPVLFDRFRKKIQEQSKWKWSGGSDLLLCNATFSGNQSRARALFDKTMACQLDKMKKDEAITSIDIFFESIVEFVERYDGPDPVSAFSDEQGLRVAGSAFKDGALALLPGKVGSEYKKAEHFAIRNLGLTSP